MKLKNRRSAHDHKNKPVILSLVPKGYFPWLRGGLELTARSVLETLIDLPAEGHLAAAPQPAPASLATRLGRKLRGAYRSGYRLDRHQVHTDLYHPAALAELVERLQPSALICHVSGDDALVKQVIDLDLPTLFYVHGSRFNHAFDGHQAMRLRRFAAESSFIGGLVSAATGEATEIIRPLLDPQRYRVDATGDAVLVVNPHPMKGGQQVVNMARALPQRTFLVVGGWAHTSDDDEVQQVEKALAQLPNVQRVAHLDDMRAVFRRSRCLLMPCEIEEAYGRVAAEALIAGVPVLASDRGALPETVGSGGVILPLDVPLATWTAALEKLFTDDAHHAQLVAAALSQAADASRQVAHVTGQLRRVVGDLLAPAEK